MTTDGGSATTRFPALSPQHHPRTLVILLFPVLLHLQPRQLLALPPAQARLPSPSHPQRRMWMHTHMEGLRSRNLVYIRMVTLLLLSGRIRKHRRRARRRVSVTISMVTATVTPLPTVTLLLTVTLLTVTGTGSAVTVAVPATVIRPQHLVPAVPTRSRPCCSRINTSSRTSRRRHHTNNTCNNNSSSSSRRTCSRTTTLSICCGCKCSSNSNTSLGHLTLLPPLPRPPLLLVVLLAVTEARRRILLVSVASQVLRVHQTARTQQGRTQRATPAQAGHTPAAAAVAAAAAAVAAAAATITPPVAATLAAAADPTCVNTPTPSSSSSSSSSSTGAERTQAATRILQFMTAISSRHMLSPRRLPTSPFLLPLPDTVPTGSSPSAPPLLLLSLPVPVSWLWPDRPVPLALRLAGACQRISPRRRLPPRRRRTRAVPCLCQCQYLCL